mmetsp:Transcript_26768/g.86688  ORF Transcript_26768/g.86688 Transcript_26768/m.86688 type:complete len:213 (+) Transcript_26768:1111-1749(+)
MLKEEARGVFFPGAVQGVSEAPTGDVAHSEPFDVRRGVPVAAPPLSSDFHLEAPRKQLATVDAGRVAVDALPWLALLADRELQKTSHVDEARGVSAAGAPSEEHVLLRRRRRPLVVEANVTPRCGSVLDRSEAPQRPLHRRLDRDVPPDALVARAPFLVTPPVLPLAVLAAVVHRLTLRAPQLRLLLPAHRALVRHHHHLNVFLVQETFFPS